MQATECWDYLDIKSQDQRFERGQYKKVTNSRSVSYYTNACKRYTVLPLLMIDRHNKNIAVEEHAANNYFSTSSDIRVVLWALSAALLVLVARCGTILCLDR